MEVLLLSWRSPITTHFFSLWATVSLNRHFGWAAGRNPGQASPQMVALSVSHDQELTFHNYQEHSVSPSFSPPPARACASVEQPLCWFVTGSGLFKMLTWFLFFP